MPQQRIGTTLTNVRSMLGNLTEWQTISGESTVADATARVYRFGYDVAFDDPPCIVLDVDGYDGTRQAGRFRGPIYVLVMMQLIIPDGSRDTPGSEAEWFWDQTESLIDGIEDNTNGSGQLAVSGLSISMPPGPLEDDDNNGRNEWVTQLRLEIDT